MGTFVKPPEATDVLVLNFQLFVCSGPTSSSSRADEPHVLTQVVQTTSVFRTWKLPLSLFFFHESGLPMGNCSEQLDVACSQLCAFL